MDGRSTPSRSHENLAVDLPTVTASPERLDSEHPTLRSSVEDLLESLAAHESELAVSKVRTIDLVVWYLVANPALCDDIDVLSHLEDIFELLGQSSPKDVRAATYRLLRHLATPQTDVALLNDRYHLDVFLIRSFARDEKCDIEKEQALRLVRHLLSLERANGGTSARSFRHIPAAVVRALVAVAESQDEQLRLPALETLVEILLSDPELLHLAGGIRVVCQCLLDGPSDLSPLIATGLIYVLDSPRLRQFIRPGLDLEVLLAAFTDASSRSAPSEERLRACGANVVRFMRSWAGLMYLARQGSGALHSLVQSLKSPSALVRELLVDMFAEVLNIPTPTWYRSRLTGRRHSAAKMPTPTVPPASAAASSTTSGGAPNLVESYLAVVVLLLVQAGLLDALASLAEGPTDSPLFRKVAFIISETLYLANRVLPPDQAARVQALPNLFRHATSFDASEARLSASSTLSAVESSHRRRNRLQPSMGAASRVRSASLDDTLKRGQRQVETARVQLSMQVSDTVFRNLLLETNVLSTKDHTRWSYDALLELAEGALLNPVRLDEAMRATKLVKRVLQLYHPFARRYSIMRRSEDSARWTRLGIAMMSALLSTTEGTRCLQDDKLLRQLGEAFHQIEPSTGRSSGSESLFTRQRMETTCASGYFEMIGALSRTAEGVRVLEHARLFSPLYGIMQLRHRDDLTAAVLTNLDYSRVGHARIILSKALVSTYRHVRTFATRHLSRMLRLSPAVHDWQVALMLTQLSDPSTEIRTLAAQTLEEACDEKPDALPLVASMRPSLDHLDAVGAPLLLKFLSTPVGVHYLHESRFIESELEDWFLQRNVLYVIEVELALQAAFSPEGSTTSSFDGSIPAHFYGELARTSEGCEILAQTGHFKQFIDYIEEHGLEADDQDILLKLKSALWVVGHVGSRTGGLAFVEEEDVLPSIVEVAEDSPVFSIRGTAFFVLNLIASTPEGVEMLTDYGWEGVCTPLGKAVGLCVPGRTEHFFSVEAWQSPPQPTGSTLASPESQAEKEVILSIANLENHILTSKASKKLARMKLRHRHLFASRSLFYRAMDMLACQHYRQPVRRYIFELFDVAVDPTNIAFVLEAGKTISSEIKSLGVSPLSPPPPLERWQAREIGLEDEMTSESEDEGDVASDAASDVAKEHSITVPVLVREPQLIVRGFLL